MSDSAALLQAVLEALNSRSESDREMFEKMSQIEQTLVRYEAPIRDVAYIVKIVRDGNGQPSLVTQVRDLRYDVNELIQSQDKVEKAKGRNWDRIVSITCALIAAGSAITVALIRLNP